MCVSTNYPAQAFCLSLYHSLSLFRVCLLITLLNFSLRLVFGHFLDMYFKPLADSGGVLQETDVLGTEMSIQKMNVRTLSL